MAYLNQKLKTAIENQDERNIDQLLKCGADPNAFFSGEDIAPIHLAPGMSKSITLLLLKYGADPNLRTSDGITPLHIAATWGNKSIVKLLLHSGANVYIRDDEGFTPLDMAKKYEHEKCEIILKQHLHILESQMNNQKQEIRPKPPLITKTKTNSKRIIDNNRTADANQNLSVDPKYWSLQVQGENPRHSIYRKEIQNQIDHLCENEEDFHLDVTSPDHPCINVTPNRQYHFSSPKHIHAYSEPVTENTSTPIRSCRSLYTTSMQHKTNRLTGCGKNVGIDVTSPDDSELFFTPTAESPLNYHEKIYSETPINFHKTNVMVSKSPDSSSSESDLYVTINEASVDHRNKEIPNILNVDEMKPSMMHKIEQLRNCLNKLDTQKPFITDEDKLYCRNKELYHSNKNLSSEKQKNHKVLGSNFDIDITFTMELPPNMVLNEKKKKKIEHSKPYTIEMNLGQKHKKSQGKNSQRESIDIQVQPKDASSHMKYKVRNQNKADIQINLKSKSQERNEEIYERKANLKFPEIQEKHNSRVQSKSAHENICFQAEQDSKLRGKNMNGRHRKETYPGERISTVNLTRKNQRGGEKYDYNDVIDPSVLITHDSRNHIKSNGHSKKGYVIRSSTENVPPNSYSHVTSRNYKSKLPFQKQELSHCSNMTEEKMITRSHVQHNERASNFSRERKIIPEKSSYTSCRKEPLIFPTQKNPQPIKRKDLSHPQQKTVFLKESTESKYLNCNSIPKNHFFRQKGCMVINEKPKVDAVQKIVSQKVVHASLDKRATKLPDCDVHAESFLLTTDSQKAQFSNKSRHSTSSATSSDIDSSFSSGLDGEDFFSCDNEQESFSEDYLTLPTDNQFLCNASQHSANIGSCVTCDEVDHEYGGILHPKRDENNSLNPVKPDLFHSCIDNENMRSMIKDGNSPYASNFSKVLSELRQKTDVKGLQSQKKTCYRWQPPENVMSSSYTDDSFLNGNERDPKSKELKKRVGLELKNHPLVKSQKSAIEKSFNYHDTKARAVYKENGRIYKENTPSVEHSCYTSVYRENSQDVKQPCYVSTCRNESKNNQSCYTSLCRDVSPCMDQSHCFSICQKEYPNTDKASTSTGSVDSPDADKSHYISIHKENFPDTDKSCCASVHKENFPDVDKSHYVSVHKEDFPDADKSHYVSVHKEDFPDADKSHYVSVHKENFPDVDKSHYVSVHKENFPDADKSHYVSVHKADFPDADKSHYVSVHKENFPDADKSHYVSVHKADFPDADKSHYVSVHKEDFPDVDKSHYVSVHKENFSDVDKFHYVSVHKEDFPDADKSHYVSVHKENFPDVDKSHYVSVQRENFPDVDKSHYVSVQRENFPDADKSHYVSVHKENFPDLDKSHYVSVHKENFPDVDKSHYVSVHKENFPDADKFHYVSVHKEDFPDADKSHYVSVHKENFPDVDKSHYVSVHKEKFPDADKFHYVSVHKEDFPDADKSHYVSVHKENFSDADKSHYISVHGGDCQGTDKSHYFSACREGSPEIIKSSHNRSVTWQNPISTSDKIDSAFPESTDENIPWSLKQKGLSPQTIPLTSTSASEDDVKQFLERKKSLTPEKRTTLWVNGIYKSNLQEYFDADMSSILPVLNSNTSSSDTGKEMKCGATAANMTNHRYIKPSAPPQSEINCDNFRCIPTAPLDISNIAVAGISGDKVNELSSSDYVSLHPSLYPSLVEPCQNSVSKMYSGSQCKGNNSELHATSTSAAYVSFDSEPEPTANVHCSPQTIQNTPRFTGKMSSVKSVPFQDASNKSYLIGINTVNKLHQTAKSISTQTPVLRIPPDPSNKSKSLPSAFEMTIQNKKLNKEKLPQKGWAKFKKIFTGKKIKGKIGNKAFISVDSRQSFLPNLSELSPLSTNTSGTQTDPDIFYESTLKHLEIARADEVSLSINFSENLSDYSEKYPSSILN